MFARTLSPIEFADSGLADCRKRLTPKVRRGRRPKAASFKMIACDCSFADVTFLIALETGPPQVLPHQSTKPGSERNLRRDDS